MLSKKTLILICLGVVVVVIAVGTLDFILIQTTGMHVHEHLFGCKYLAEDGSCVDKDYYDKPEKIKEKDLTDCFNSSGIRYCKIGTFTVNPGSVETEDFEIKIKENKRMKKGSSSLELSNKS